MLKIFLSLLLLIPTLTFGALPIDGWYGSIFGGFAFFPDNLSVTHWGFLRNNADYQTGYQVLGSLGYKANPIRFEGELTYLNAEFDNFHLNHYRQFNVEGQTSAALALLNMYYDLNDWVYSLQPYLGIGLGYAWVNTHADSVLPIFSHYEDSSSVYAYQAILGLAYNFSEFYSFSLDYRYISTARVAALGKPFQAHTANLGFTWRLDGNYYK